MKTAVRPNKGRIRPKIWIEKPNCTNFKVFPNNKENGFATTTKNRIGIFSAFSLD
jgi:hypothetical protein